MTTAISPVTQTLWAVQGACGRFLRRCVFRRCFRRQCRIGRSWRRFSVPWHGLAASLSGAPDWLQDLLLLREYLCRARPGTPQNPWPGPPPTAYSAAKPVLNGKSRTKSYRSGGWSSASRCQSHAVFLSLLWLLLSGYFTEPLLLGLGVASVLSVVFIAHRMQVSGPGRSSGSFDPAGAGLLAMAFEGDRYGQHRCRQGDCLLPHGDCADRLYGDGLAAQRARAGDLCQFHHPDAGHGHDRSCGRQAHRACADPGWAGGREERGNGPPDRLASRGARDVHAWPASPFSRSWPWRWRGLSWARRSTTVSWRSTPSAP